jgi:surface antigen
MSARKRPYTGERVPRQSPPYYRGMAVAALALSLGGCAGLGLPFGGETTMAAAHGGLRPTLVSASVVDGVDASDWETIRRTVAGTPATANVDRVEWTNPDTGSTGVVADLTPAAREGKLFCRTFATTVNDPRGIRRYRGEACQRTDGRWQLYGMAADDLKLS